MMAQARHDSARRAGLKRRDSVNAADQSAHVRKAWRLRWRRKRTV
jgi:hypothetical protein